MPSKDRFLLLFIILSVVVLTGAKPSAKSGEDGISAYKEGNYDESAEHFLDAINDGGNPDILRFNLGNAQYKMGDYGMAEENYRIALDEKESSIEEYYNLGNSLTAQAESMVATGMVSDAKGFLEGAAEAYGKALEIDYADVDTIHNLEYVKRRLQELEEQETPDDGTEGEGEDTEEGSDQDQQQQTGDQEGESP